MKKIFKNRLFIFILGMVVSLSGVVVASNYIASDISYTPSDSNWKVSNVAEAINSIELSKTSTNYSTEEKVVGTWIDGKPLYQKTILFDSILVSINAEIPISFPDASNVDRFIYSWSYSPNRSGTGAIYIEKSSKANEILLYTQGINFYCNGITVQYTKTTDQALNS